MIGSSMYIRVVSTVFGEKLGVAWASHSRQSAATVPFTEHPDWPLIDLGHHGGECLGRVAFCATECALDVALSAGVGISASVDSELPRVVASLSHGACHGASCPFCPSRLADCIRMDGQ